MRVAPDDPEKVLCFESRFFCEVFRHAGVPFTSSNFSGRKTRWVDFGKVVSEGNDWSDRHGSRSRIEDSIAGRQCPGGASQFVGEGTGDDLGVPSGKLGTDPIGKWAALPLMPLHVRPSTLNQQAPDVFVAPLTDPQ